MRLAAALVYWVIVALWLTVLGTIIASYVRGPRAFGTTRLLLFVLAIDTLRNISENIYFGIFFGGQYGLFPPGVVPILGQKTVRSRSRDGVHVESSGARHQRCRLILRPGDADRPDHRSSVSAGAVQRVYLRFDSAPIVETQDAPGVIS